MNEWDFAVIGIVEMSYNWLSYRVIHDGIVSYAHFHDAVFMASLFILQKFDISYVFDFTSSIYDKKRRRKYHKEKRRKLL